MTTPHAQRAAPSSQGLHFSFEKAGLTLDRQPIPWNAEAVLVEANVRVSHVAPADLRDYVLFLPGGRRVQAESSRPGQTGQTRVFFRLAAPTETMPAEVRWRERSLGQINLPLLTREEFVRGLTIAEPTIHVRLGNDAYACQAYVTSQAKEIFASMLLTSPTSLAPLTDLELSASLVSGETLIERHVVRLESNQRAGRQALVVVPFMRPRARMQHWDIGWTIDETVYAMRSIRCATPVEFLKSLRISTTRLYLEGAGGMLPLARIAPSAWEGITRVGPVFLVCSGIPGMAAGAEFRVRALDRKGKTLLDMPPVSVLVTDGPTVIAPGTLPRDDNLASFELWSGKRKLGDLRLDAAPSATFTAEGGIAGGRADFAWSPEAEELLQHRLGQLLGGQ
ncbi:MAG: hypothetical protein WCL32_18400 [Planctomycetota bacterium]